MRSLDLQEQPKKKRRKKAHFRAHVILSFLTMAASLMRTEYYYDTENALQNVAVWEFPEELAKIPAEPAGKPKYWLM